MLDDEELDTELDDDDDRILETILPPDTNTYHSSAAAVPVEPHQWLSSRIEDRPPMVSPVVVRASATRVSKPNVVNRMDQSPPSSPSSEFAGVPAKDTPHTDPPAAAAVHVCDVFAENEMKFDVDSRT